MASTRSIVLGEGVIIAPAEVDGRLRSALCSAVREQAVPAGLEYDAWPARIPRSAIGDKAIIRSRQKDILAEVLDKAVLDRDITEVCRVDTDAGGVAADAEAEAAEHAVTGTEGDAAAIAQEVLDDECAGIDGCRAGTDVREDHGRARVG